MQCSFSTSFCLHVLFGCSLIKGRVKKKKRVGDSSENGICSCGLPAHCCQPAVAGSVVYADLCGELSTHVAPQAVFVQSSPVREPLLQAFPFPSTGNGDTAPALSGLRVYLQFMWVVGLSPSPVKFSSHCHFHKLSCSCLLGGAAAPASLHVCLQFTHGKWVFPTLLWSFPPSATLTSFPAPGCWVHALPPPWPEPLQLAWLIYLQFIYSPGKGSLPLIFSAQGAPPSFQCLYCCYCLLLSFSFFPGWRSVCPVGYAGLA
jgi:hypothetical protein